MTELTRRMKFILKQMKQGAVIEEHRDAFLEKSWYELTDHNSLSTEITRKMLRKLRDANLIVIRENNPRYRYGEFITSEAVFSIPPVDTYWGYKIYQYETGFWCELPDFCTQDGPEPLFWTAETKSECLVMIDNQLGKKALTPPPLR